ncbi:MAG: hypothetical protein LLG42_06065 [Chloroflexi bacterium]|nr:hypothetical protein [Chloroflexota bacterium]
MMVVLPMRYTKNIENVLTQDQITAMIETWEKMCQAIDELWELIKEAVIKIAKDIYDKFVKPFIRHLFLLQLLEWNVPFWLARILKKSVPFIWARGIGLRFLEKS